MLKKKIWFWIMMIGLFSLWIPRQSGAIGLEAAVGLSYQDFRESWAIKEIPRFE